MTELAIKELPWDSQFFGFRVGRVDAPGPPIYLPSLLKAAAAQGMRLLYLRVANHKKAGTAPACRNLEQYHIVDNVTLKCSTRRPAPSNDLPGHYTLSRYTDANPDASVVELAIQAGWSSRFKLDPRVGEAAYHRMYRTWIQRSCQGELADAVYSIRDPGGSHVAILTLTTEGKSCSIGLLAVSQAHRGRGLGKSLIRQSHRFADSCGATRISVVTQTKNSAALHLYRSAGFEPRETYAWHHIWVDRHERT